MRVLGYSTYGAPNVFVEKTMPVPTINNDEILLKTMYVSIHPVDTIIRGGGFSGGQPLRQFLILGSEILGEIVALGKR